MSIRPNPFPRLSDFSAETLEPLGYHAFAVSAFDHWLSEGEASSALMYYPQAVEEGRMREFLETEQRFLALYDCLANGGVSRVRAHGELEPLKPASRRFHEVVIANGRERLTDVRPPRRARTRYMDLYFHLWDARVIGQPDRTDWFFCRSPDKIERLIEVVREAGLHVLL